jgi:hypothetical protein
LTSRLERTVVSEKMIEDDLSHVEDSATKSTYMLGFCNTHFLQIIKFYQISSALGCSLNK